MQLSVIIVNYNVKHFLEQALLSAQQAMKGIDGEIIVVDNNSVDGSVDVVRQKFPEVILIANTENTGFSKANNQAIHIARGTYVLLLNPDTVVEEDTFKKCLSFMDTHTDAGALGVKMVDGKGHFLPESKRGFPSPWVAFCKAFGLTRFFPHSKLFAQYYLGHLPSTETHAVDVLAGAFMFIRKSVLEKIGYLDEDFFMYGEDIDLSYRIVKAGYKNYYLADTRIIHYKGESTKRGSLNYVRIFYQAMIIFARKHLTGSKAGTGIYIAFIQAAIYVRAFITLLTNTLRHIAWPLFDAGVIYLLMYGVKIFWENTVKANEHTHYLPEFMQIAVPIYIATWLLGIYVNGGYKKHASFSRVLRGMALSTLCILAVYGLLDNQWRFSRGMILTGAALSVITLALTRLFANVIRYKKWVLTPVWRKRIVIAGDAEEVNRVQTLLQVWQIPADVIGCVLVHDNNHPLKLGLLSVLDEVCRVHRPDEIIFCAKDIPTVRIIEWMTRIGQLTDFKIAPVNGDVFIGSNSKYTQGDLYTIDISIALNKPSVLQAKRLLDIVLSLVILVLTPLWIWRNRYAGKVWHNALRVITGKHTWVGYAMPSAILNDLPKLKIGVLSPLDSLSKSPLTAYAADQINLQYARQYTIWRDLEVMLKNIVLWGR